MMEPESGHAPGCAALSPPTTCAATCAGPSPGGAGPVVAAIDADAKIREAHDAAARAGVAAALSAPPPPDPPRRGGPCPDHRFTPRDPEYGRRRW